MLRLLDVNPCEAILSATCLYITEEFFHLETPVERKTPWGLDPDGFIIENADTNCDGSNTYPYTFVAGVLGVEIIGNVQ